MQNETRKLGRSAVTARGVRCALAVVTGLGAVALSATAAVAATSTLYVNGGSSSCSDAGPGSQAAPFCTISAAAARAVAGQTVLVSSGTYRESVTVKNSGTSGAPLVFAAAQGATVTVTGGTNGFKLSGLSYVQIKRFTVTNTVGVGILVSGSNHITVESNVVSVAGQGSGSVVKGISLSGTTRSVVRYNTTHDNSDAGIGITSASNNNFVTGNNSYGNARPASRAAAGIDLRNSTGNQVNGNYLHDNQDSGLNIWNSSNGTIAVNNVLSDNGDHGIDVHSTNDAVVVSNTVFRNYDSGIEMTGSLRTYLQNNISADNGINSLRTSGQLRADSTSAPSTTADYDVLFLSAPQNSQTVYLDWGGTKYSSLSAFQAATGQEAHGIQADPQFVNPGTHASHSGLPGGLRLQSGSPAIDSGNNAATGEPAVDFDGVARPVNGTVDRGAFEFH
jgi:parallel beta-helix repeat protein